MFKLNYTEISFNTKKIKYQHKILFFGLKIAFVNAQNSHTITKSILYQKNGINTGFKYFWYGKFKYKAFMLKF